MEIQIKTQSSPFSKPVSISSKLDNTLRDCLEEDAPVKK
jgi:hypothetical protein